MRRKKTNTSKRIFTNNHPQKCQIRMTTERKKGRKKERKIKKEKERKKKERNKRKKKKRMSY